MTTREFTLQPALSHKKRLEEVCQMELAEIEVAYARERQTLELLTRMEVAGFEQLHDEHSPGPLNTGLISIYMYDLENLQRRIDEQIGLLEALAEKVQQKREELLEVCKEKKALENLKDKHAREIAKAVDRAENKIMEDIVTSQYHRRKLGPLA